MANKESLETEVALLTQAHTLAQDNTTAAIVRLEKKVDSNQLEILKRMDKFAFVSTKDFNDQVKVQSKIDEVQDKRILAVEQFIADNKTGIESSTKVTSGVGKLIFASVILGVFAIILYFGWLVAPALGGGK